MGNGGLFREPLTLGSGVTGDLIPAHPPAGPQVGYGIFWQLKATSHLPQLDDTHD